MESQVEKNSSTSSFKRTPKAFLLALMVILTVDFLELFVLSINTFTFRVWESLSVYHFTSLLPGPFYPKKTLSMEEEGDLAAHTKLAVKKKVLWETDRYGYRKRDGGGDQYDIVVIGDSIIAGSSLTQRDIYSEQLGRKLKRRVYPYAPSNINNFLSDERFKKNPPGIVIFESIERFLLLLPPLSRKASESLEGGGFFRGYFKDHPEVVVLADRKVKNLMARSISSAIGRKIRNATQRIFLSQREGDFSVMRFINIERSPSMVETEQIAQRIKSYRDVIEARGFRFVFFPAPDKNTVYWRLSSKKEKPVFLKRLLARLKELRVEVIDVTGVFEKASEEGKPFIYSTDDTHWNARGVAVAVEVSVEKLTE